MNLLRHAQDPSEAVERAFFLIHRDRMADVPIVNPALQVEAVDFQPWQGHWLGVIVTPWCMSVMLLPGAQAPWETVPVQKRRQVTFPYGSLAFLGSTEPGLGEYQTCALFSPMDKFATQAQAVDTARASLLALLAPPPGTPADPGAAEGPAPKERRPSRRGFLGMRERSPS